MRQQGSLDGPWQFQIDPQGQYTADDITTWRTIQVPGPWQAQFDDLHLVAGLGWYRRTVEVDAAWAGKSIFLCVGAADYAAEVWINGQSVGEHEGGYLPFEFDVSAAIKPGDDNEIIIRVVDPGPGDSDIFPGFPFGEIPHGKQSWYGPVGGLWQSVYLEARPAQFIQSVHATPQGLNGDVSVGITLSQASADAMLIVRCVSPDGDQVAGESVTLAAGQTDTQVDLTIPDPVLWDLDHPALYTLAVELAVGGGTHTDTQTVRFGLRTFEARDGKLWLNGHPFYMRGALDQDYYPHGIYTPPSLDFLRAQVRQAKAMGLNCLRCHIKVPDPRYLQAADEEGILVWAEVPSWKTRTERAGDRVRETFAEMVERDWNHPSLMIWSIVNENWGTDLVNSAADRQWLAETMDWARDVEPNRLIVDNSACFINFHMKTDIEDYHFYSAMPEGMDRWQEYVDNFAARSPFTFSQNDDAMRTGTEPLVISEFGNWGLPDIDLLREAYDGKDPWWFDTGEEWDPPVVWPLHAEERFADAGLARVFGNWSGLAKKAQWAQYRALKHEIEVMRAESALAGYVITEWTDLHWECNGLVDMARNPRVFAKQMLQFSADTVIVPRWDRLAYWAGEAVQVAVLLSHYGRQVHSGVTLHWALEGTDLHGSIADLCLEPGQVQNLGGISFVAPETSAPALYMLTFELASPDAGVVAHNSLPITMFGTAAQRASEPVSVWSDDADLRARLEAQGYQLDADNGLRVVRRLDKATQQFVEAGGRALVCATSSGALTEALPDLRIEARQGTPWSGDWASSFAWVQPGVTRVPGGPLLDFGWRGVFPEHIITGLDSEQTLAGLFVGWVHMPVGLIGRVPLGVGEVLVTTFPVLPADNIPVRIVLLQDLIRLIASGT